MRGNKLIIVPLLLGSVLASAQTIFPTGTTIYKPDEAYSSYILISDHTSVGNHPNAKVREEGAGKFPDDIRLIDMNGNLLHTWKVDPYFNKRSRLLPNGNLVCVGLNKTIIEYDWDGKVVWTHQGIGSVNDLRVLRNNNRLLLAHEPMPEASQSYSMIVLSEPTHTRLPLGSNRLLLLK